MDVTVVCEDRYRDYIMDTFMKHRNDKWTLSAFGACKERNMLLLMMNVHRIREYLFAA